MHSSNHFSLQQSNSFNVDSVCPVIYFPASVEDLAHLPDLTSTKFYVLGEGSNTLFVEECSPVIIKPSFKGVDIREYETHFTVLVGASENWHELVTLCIEKGINGLENLALIPGTVGAAPVQNIGAYGAEFSDFCLEIKWFEFTSKTVKTLSKAECLFSYRDSIFKQALHNKGMIIEVLLTFPKVWQANLSYAGLNEFNSDPTAKMIMDKVIQLRQSKLPDPDELANAGSFFKNPIVTLEKFKALLATYPNIPNYPQANGEIKLAAGWLIEQAGLKGYRVNEVGVHSHQALVLVNYGSRSGKDILALANFVQQQVYNKFSILLVPEVRMVSKSGEKSFEQLMSEQYV